VTSSSKWSTTSEHGWIGSGVDHWNTDNPHIHLIVRGADDRGDMLVIHRDYITHGMRQRAAELVTIELGPQSEHEVRHKLAGEVGADRWTRLDAALRREAQRTEDGVLDFRPEAARSGAVRDEIRALLIDRLEKLERMGPARAIGPARWQLAEDAEPSLRELGPQGDIIRTMQRALSAQGQDLAIFDAPIASEQTIIGRVIEKGLHDELKGSAYLVLDGVDGLGHYLRVGSIDGLSDVSEGAIVAVGRAQASDRTRPSRAWQRRMMASTIRSAIGPNLRAPMPPIRKHWSKHMCAGWKRCGVGADTSSGYPMAGGVSRGLSRSRPRL
jgi:Protein of unknown function (DUF3363)